MNKNEKLIWQKYLDNETFHGKVLGIDFHGDICMCVECLR